MIHLGDITKMTPESTPMVDCITFGSPCQDLSIAGKRAGLAGERSGLFMEAVRVIRQMRERSFGGYPKFAVWENVPGAFSSNKGEDFRAVLEELAHIKEPEVSIPRPENGKWARAGFISGNGWSIAWRTFDAQFWGVPQRRRRIAVVLDLGGQRAGEILFERTGVSGDSEPCVPAWQGIARDPAHGIAGHDRVVVLQGNMIDRDVQQNGSGLAESEIMFTLNTTDRHGVCFGVDGYNGCETGDKSITIRAGKSDQDHVGCVAIPINTQITTRHISLGERTGMGWGSDGDPAYTLQAGHEHAVLCAAFSAGQGAKANGIGWSEEQAPTLKAADCGSNRAPTVLCRAQANTNAETYENLSPTLTTCHDGSPILFESHSQDARYTQQGDTSPACVAQWGTGGNNMPLVVRKILPWIVRRLIATECERLQGYPDGWTDIGEWIDSKGKRHKPADGPKYKALGNSIALPQWWWITCKMARYLPEHATLGSLFDGIGGFPLVWETRHGKGTAVWASEIEEFPIAVTKKHFGGSE